MMFIPTKEQYNDAISFAQAVEWEIDHHYDLDKSDKVAYLHAWDLIETFEAIYHTKEDYLKAV